MAFTASSDFYGAVHEDGFNKVIGHIMAQRPSLFNYGTAWVAEQWWDRLCCPPRAIDDRVLQFNNPVVTIESPLPVLGTGGAYSLNWSAQLTELAVDFHPTDHQLPSELGTNLDQQQLSVRARICGGIGCPPDWAFYEFPPPEPPPFVVPGSEHEEHREERDRPDPITLPAGEMACFELELWCTAHAELDGPDNARVVELVVDGIEIVDIEPAGLEGSIECYLMSILRWVVMPRMRLLLPVFVLNIPMGLGSVTLSAATSMPHNPAIEEDQLKVFVDMEVAA